MMDTASAGKAWQGRIDRVLAGSESSWARWGPKLLQLADITLRMGSNMCV